MKNVLVSSATNQSELQKILNENDYDKPILLRMGLPKSWSSKRFALELNDVSPIIRSLDRAYVKDMCRGLLISHERYYMEVAEIGYPHIFKSRFKVHNRRSVNYVECSNDFKVARSMIKGERYILESIFHASKEYRLLCTRKEVFCVLEKVKESVEDIISTRLNSTYVEVVENFPKLLPTMKRNALSVMAHLGLDIGAVDILYTDSTFRVTKVTTDPYLSPKIVNVYANQIDKLIRNGLQ